MSNFKRKRDAIEPYDEFAHYNVTIPSYMEAELIRSTYTPVLYTIKRVLATGELLVQPLLEHVDFPLHTDALPAPVSPVPTVAASTAVPQPDCNTWTVWETCMSLYHCERADCPRRAENKHFEYALTPDMGDSVMQYVSFENNMTALAFLSSYNGHHVKFLNCGNDSLRIRNEHCSVSCEAVLDPRPNLVIEHNPNRLIYVTFVLRKGTLKVLPFTEDMPCERAIGFDSHLSLAKFLLRTLEHCLYNVTALVLCVDVLQILLVHAVKPLRNVSILSIYGASSKLCNGDTVQLSSRVFPSIHTVYISYAGLECKLDLGNLRSLQSMYITTNGDVQSSPADVILPADCHVKHAGIHIKNASGPYMLRSFFAARLQLDRLASTRSMQTFTLIVDTETHAKGIHQASRVTVVRKGKSTTMPSSVVCSDFVEAFWTCLHHWTKLSKLDIPVFLVSYPPSKPDGSHQMTHLQALRFRPAHSPFEAVIRSNYSIRQLRQMIVDSVGLFMPNLLQLEVKTNRADTRLLCKLMEIIRQNPNLKKLVWMPSGVTYGTLRGNYANALPVLAICNSLKRVVLRIDHAVCEARDFPVNVYSAFAMKRVVDVDIVVGKDVATVEAYMNTLFFGLFFAKGVFKSLRLHILEQGRKAQPRVVDLMPAMAIYAHVLQKTQQTMSIMDMNLPRVQEQRPFEYVAKLLNLKVDTTYWHQVTTVFKFQNLVTFGV